MAAATDPRKVKLYVSDLLSRWDNEFTDEGVRYLIRTGRLPGGRERRRKDKRRPYYSTLDAVRAFEAEHPRLAGRVGA